MRILCLAGVMAAACCFASDPPRSVQGNRIVNPPIIDGVMGEGEWAEAAHLQGFVDPVTNNAPADNTEVWVGYDDSAIYLAYLCHDTQPDKIVARANQPNSNLNSEDSVVFLIDPFNRRSYAGINRFQVSAKGTQNERIAGGRAAKREWRGEWQSAAKVTEQGYVVEIRIPWQMIDLPPSQQRDMQVNFWRIQSRTKVVSGWSNTTPRELPELDGIWTGVTPPVAKQQSKLSVLGYIAPEYEEGKSDVRIGGDVRYKVNPRQTALLSIRPDFKNIEQQVEGINFTRTERYLDDSRPFFSEGSEFFTAGHQYSIGRMFYSRRIQDFDWGAKYFGALDQRSSVGALMTRDAGERTDAMVKFRHEYKPRNAVAAYATHTGLPGFENSAFGLVGGFNSGNWSAGLDYAVADFNGQSDDAQSAVLAYSSENDFAEFRWTDVSENFRPPLALIPWTDRVGAYGFYLNQKEMRSGPLRRQEVNLFLEDYEHHDGSNFVETVELSGSVVTRSNYALGAGTLWQKFESDRERTHNIFFSGNVDNPYRGYSLYYNWGERAGQPTKYVSVSGQYRFPGNIDVSLSTSLLDFQGRTDQTVFGLGWEIDPSQSISARLVRRDGNTNWYMAYRKAGFSGLEWFVIIGDPNATKFKERVVVKLVWAA